MSTVKPQLCVLLPLAGLQHGLISPKKQLRFKHVQGPFVVPRLLRKQSLELMGCQGVNNWAFPLFGLFPALWTDGNSREGTETELALQNQPRSGGQRWELQEIQRNSGSGCSTGSRGLSVLLLLLRATQQPQATQTILCSSNTQEHPITDTLWCFPAAEMI